MNARILLLFGLAVVPSAGFQSLESTYRRTGNAVVAAFESQRQVLQRSSAVMLDRRNEVAYGVVVSSDGFILTKASEIGKAGTLWVRVDEETYRDAVVVAVDEAWDVALVKIAAENLTPVVYAPAGEVPRGTWVVANGVTSMKNRRALAGIVSAKPRGIPDGGGNLGAAFKEDAAEAVIEDVARNGGAGAAGLKKGDVILAVDGRKVRTFDEIAEILKTRRPGVVVKITYSRKGKEQTAEVRLDPGPLTRNDMMSGMFSERRSGFPRVIQHDIIGDKNTMGGPLLNLDGRCLGMNIARVNRAESFAIPVEELKSIAERMMKGR